MGHVLVGGCTWGEVWAEGVNIVNGNHVALGSSVGKVLIWYHTEDCKGHYFCTNCVTS